MEASSPPAATTAKATAALDPRAVPLPAILTTITVILLLLQEAVVLRRRATPSSHKFRAYGAK